MLKRPSPFTVPAESNCMGFHTIAGAAFRALTARKVGPSLYDVCDPVLLKYRGGDPHLGKFYRTALGNPALRPLLRRTGLPALRDEKRLGALQEALRRARDEAEPDWAAAGGGAWPGARGKRDRPGDPPLRRAPVGLVCQKRLHPDLCGLQPDRRRRHGRARNADGADRAELARLQELDALVQPGADLHRAFARPRPDQPGLDRDCRADVAADADPPPLGLLRRLFHRGVAELCRDRAGVCGRGRGVAARDFGDGGFLPEDLSRGSALA